MKRILIKIIRVLVKTLYISSLFLILLAGIVLFLLDTKPGLHTLIQFSRLYLPGTLKIQQLEGSLLNHFTLNGIEYQNKSFNVKIEQFEVQWQPHSLRESQLVTARWKGLHWNRAKKKS